MSIFSMTDRDQLIQARAHMLLNIWSWLKTDLSCTPLVHRKMKWNFFSILNGRIKEEANYRKGHTEGPPSHGSLCKIPSTPVALMHYFDQNVWIENTRFFLLDAWKSFVFYDFVLFRVSWGLYISITSALNLDFTRERQREKTLIGWVSWPQPREFLCSV